MQICVSLCSSKHCVINECAVFYERLALHTIPASSSVLGLAEEVIADRAHQAEVNSDATCLLIPAVCAGAQNCGDVCTIGQDSVWHCYVKWRR